MLKTIGLVVVLILVVILVLALTKPNTFRVERSVTINASPEKVATLVNDFHQWDRWSPWAKLDPGMKTVYSGSQMGPGAVYEWEGNSKVGKGRMEIVSTDPAKTTVKLDFLKPFESHNMTNFVLEPEGAASTRVSWIMTGPMNFMTKVMAVFTDMNKMIGPDFDRGLANMKAAAEQS